MGEGLSEENGPKNKPAPPNPPPPDNPSLNPSPVLLLLSIPAPRNPHLVSIRSHTPASIFAGSVTANSLPFGPERASSALPPCASATSCAIANPSPAPLVDVRSCRSRERSTRKNRSNKCDCASGGMPGPWSATLKRYVPLLRSSPTCTTVSASEY